jgi:hypothetical protein
VRHALPVFQRWPYTQILAPLVGFLVVGIFILLLRWAFSRGHSLVALDGRPGREDEYGLLVPVSAPLSHIEGEILRQELDSSGIRSKVVNTLDGPRVMVFPRDEERAKRLLQR